METASLFLGISLSGNENTFSKNHEIPHALPTILCSLLASQALVADQKTMEQNQMFFILIDDWGWKDVGYNGSPFYETPEIDKLSKEWPVRHVCC